MSPNNVRTRGERMREHGGPRFTGRTKETETFEQTIDAIKKQSKKELEKVKTAFDIYGEGGMGKTWLLWEFERICRRKNIIPIYFDIRLWDDPSISTVVDFLKILRKHLGQSVPLQKFLGANPFANFDQCYARYMGLEELRKRDETKNSPTPSTAERLSKLGTKMALGFGKLIPYVNEAAELVGKENVEEAADITRESVLNSVQDIRVRLQRIFNNNGDVQFYLDHQDELINALVRVVSEISEKYYLVILIDSYEDILHLDVELREKIFNLLPENVVLVLSGRNSIRNNCSPGWQEDMHFYAMEEFSNKESEEYLGKRNIKNRELIRAVWDFTQGMPLAVALTADIYDELSGNVKETLKAIRGVGQGKHKDKKESIIEQITERFLNLVPSSERKTIDICAVLGEMSIDAIEYMLEEKLSDAQIGKLENYSFMRGHDNNFVIHKTVRNFLLTNLHLKKPKYLSSLHAKAAKYADEQLAKINVKEKFQDENWVHWSLERAYHLIQTDPNDTGREEFYKSFSNGLWETEFDYCTQLIEITDQPVKTAKLQGLEQLQKGCNACRSKEYQQAIVYFKQLIDLKTSSPYFEQMIHDTLGDLYQRVESYPDAIKHYEVALKYFRAFNDSSKIAITLNNIAECLLASDKALDAIDRLKESIDIGSKLDDTSLLVYATYLISETYQQSDKNQDAAEALKKCCEMYKELGQQENLAYTYFSLGRTQHKLNLYEETVESLQNAIHIQTSLNDKEGQAKTWKELFGVYKDHKEYLDAIDACEKALMLYEELEKPEDVAGMLNRKGIAYREWGKFSEALEQHRVALEQFKKLDKQYGVVNVLNSIGKTFLNWGRYPEAVDEFDKAKQITQGLENQEGFTEVLYWLGIAYRKYGKYEQAIEQYRIAFKHFEKTNKKNEMASVLFTIGDTYKEWGKYSEAIDAIKKAQKIFESLGELDVVAALSNQLGIFYREWGKYDESLAQYQIAFQQFENLSKKSDMADVMIGIGITNRDWSKFSDAVMALGKSKSIYEELNQPKDIAGVWRRIGGTYEEWRKYKQSVESYHQALASFEKLDDSKSNIAEILFRIGVAYRNWEKYIQAIESIRASKTIYEELTQPEDIAKSYQQLGRTYREWGRYEDALANYNQALADFEKNGKKAMVADVWLGIGIAYRDWGKYPDSEEAIEKCKSIYEELNQPEEVRYVWNQLGATYSEWGKYEQAIKCHQHAIEGLDQLSKRNEIVGVYLQISNAYTNWGQYQNAIEALEKCRKIYEEAKYEFGIADLWHELAIKYREWGKYDDALSSYQKSLERFKKLESKYHLAEVLHGIGRTNYEAENFQEAIANFEEAISIFEETDSSVDKVYVLRRLGQAYAKLGEIDRSHEIVNAALNIALQLKITKLEADCYLSLIIIHQASTNDIQVVRSIYNKAIELYNNNGSKLGVAELNWEMGRLESQKGEINNALVLLNDAVVTFREFTRLPKLAKALKELGKLQKEIRADDAILSLEESAQLFIDMQKEEDAASVRALMK